MADPGKERARLHEERSRMYEELRAIIQEPFTKLYGDLRKLRTDFRRDVRQELLSTWNERFASVYTECGGPQTNIANGALHKQELRQLAFSQAMEEDIPTLATAYKERGPPEFKDPNDAIRKRQLAIARPIEESDPDDICKEPLQQLAFTRPMEGIINLSDLKRPTRRAAQPALHTTGPAMITSSEDSDAQAADDAMLPGRLDNTDTIGPPESSPPAMTMSDGHLPSSAELTSPGSRSNWTTDTGKRFRQKRTRNPRLQNAMGLVPEIERERVNHKHDIYRKLEDVVRSRYFELFSMSVVLTSAIMIGLAINYRATQLTEDIPMSYRVIDTMFLLYFIIELIVKFVTFGARFFSIFGWIWNVFDLLLVIFQCFEEIMKLWSLTTKPFNSTEILRMCRILRAVRCVRMMKLTLFARELRLLASCVVHSVGSFFWASTFLFLIVYIKAIYITDSIVSYRIEIHQSGADDGGLAKYFGTVPQSCLSLFQALSGGADWNDMLLPLSYSLWHTVLFTFFIAFGLLAVLNLVTGLFVNSSMERAQAVKDLQRLVQARELFKALDIDSSDQITEDELMSHIDSHAVQEFLSRVDIEKDELRVLFDILDKDNGGSIDFEEFVSGLLHLSGSAKSMDLLIMSHEMHRFFDDSRAHKI